METIFNKLSTTEILNIFKGFDGFLRLLAIAVTIALYYFIVDYYNKDLNIFPYLDFGKREYGFFTGTEPGMYYKIGSELEGIGNYPKFYDAIITNKGTGGGNENPLKVMHEPNSFGLVEDDCYPRDEKVVRSEVNFISPLYLEQMHVLCKQDSIILSNFTDAKTLKYISKSNIYIGKQGGGTILLSTYLINQLNIQISKINEHRRDKIALIGKNIVRNNQLRPDDMFDLSEIDIWFFVTGTPNGDMLERIERGDGFLATIEPDLISSINQQYKLDLHPTNFYNYETQAYKSTFGTYCYLVANKNIPNVRIMSFLEKLDLLAKRNPDLPLKEIDFVSNYQEKYNSNVYNVIKNLLLFLSTVLVGSVLLGSFLIWVYSKYTFDLYNDKLTVISTWIAQNEFQTKQGNEIFGNLLTELDLPNRDELIKIIEPGGNNLIFKPDIKKEQFFIVNRLMLAAHQIFSIRKKISESGSHGGLITEHYNLLISNSHGLLEKFRKEIALRLYLIKSNSNYGSSEEINKELICELISCECLDVSLAKDLGLIDDKVEVLLTSPRPRKT